MNAHDDHALSIGDVITDLAGYAAALGAMTMTLFPFALPAIALAAVVVVPLVLVAIVVGLLAAVVAGPVMAVAAVRRRLGARRHHAVVGAASALPS